jgi:hypothetical protein
MADETISGRYAMQKLVYLPTGSDPSLALDKAPGVFQSCLQGVGAQYGFPTVLPAEKIGARPHGRDSLEIPIGFRLNGMARLASGAHRISHGTLRATRLGRRRSGLLGLAWRRSPHLEKKDDQPLASRIRQIGAGRGKRSPKSGQSNYFVGYKKHTVYGLFRRERRWQPVPLFSLARAANVGDVQMMKPLLNFVRRRLNGVWPFSFAIGDKGYISAERACFLREQWHVALVVKPRKGMAPPAGADSSGCPLCPAGEALVWDDYAPDAGVLLYEGERAACTCCPLSGTCSKHFEFPAGAHETFWGMVPSHSQLARDLLRRFRPRIEPGFNTAKNRFALKDFFLNSRHMAQILCTLCDITETLEIIAQERPSRGRETKKAMSRDIKQPELWG